MERGCANLDKHIENLKKFGLPIVVAINRFPTDEPEELALVKKHCDAMGVRSAISEVVAKGGEGGIELAKEILAALEHDENFAPIYDPALPIKEKIEILAREIYGADGVVYTASADKDIARLTKLGFDKLPICMAKTQHSLSDNRTSRAPPRAGSSPSGRSGCRQAPASWCA